VTSNEQPLIEITDDARAKVLSFKLGQPDEDKLALWLEITGAVGLEFAYDMFLGPIDEAEPDDLIQHHDDLAVVIPAASVDGLRGARLVLVGDLVIGNLKIENPNSPSPAVGVGGASGLSGDVSQRVAQVLELHVNPAIASHGGKAELDHVEGSTAFLRLSGGCQGCGMAKVTLSQGIESAIMQSVPEITEVVDVTDHAGGANPYFQPSPS
jgi:Fe/S biogenesis protein NfuA